ncbi:MAG: hypothetical protein PVJ21_08885 [Anaerolineales bacterium]
MILRLAFVTETYVPPYFDSVEHYRIINELVTTLESSTLLKTIPTLTPNYYHLGFHFLASFLTFGLRANPIDTILVLGQVILAAVPIPLYFLIRAETRSVSAALFGILLAGFGWYMPGFAVNWGKYPALAGMFAFELVLITGYSFSRRNAKRNRTLLISILILSIFISTLFHTRTPIVILISLISWFVANKLRNLSKTIQVLSLGFLLAGLLILGIFVQQESLLNLAFDPYLEDGIWITLTVLLLSPLAFIKFPRGVYFCVLFTILILTALFIQIGNLLPGLENQTLLDRPFVEMILYLPLSMLGGLGLVGLLKFVNDIKIIPEQVGHYTQILIACIFIGITGLTSTLNYNFYPSDCCNFVHHDDTVALDWLDRNTPSDARILVSSTQMHVLPSGPSANTVGTDAGIWIPALTGKDITYENFEIDFRLEDVLEMLCQKEIEYIYIGGTSQSFNASYLIAKKDWYNPILSSPDTQLFQVTGCFK